MGAPGLAFETWEARKQINFFHAFFLKNRLEHRESDLARAHRLRREAGLPIADLTASNPTRCGFSYPADLLAPLADPRPSTTTLSPAAASARARPSAAYYASHGVSVDPSQILLTTSTSEAYSFLFRLLCDPGAEVLVPHPGYPLFDFLAALDDVRLVPFPLVFDHGWQIDPEALRRAITPRTRAIVVIHPNNPTGHFTKSWEAAELARLCREFDLSLIVDEVFLDYALAARQATSDLNPVATFAAGLDGVPVFVVSGLSKIAGLPQMKAAWIVVPPFRPARVAIRPTSKSSTGSKSSPIPSSP